MGILFNNYFFPANNNFLLGTKLPEDTTVPINWIAVGSPVLIPLPNEWPIF